MATLPEDIEIRLLRYFVTLAEELHFGVASERLGISQPSLSRQIQLLEQLLGAPLFHRTQRQVQLTDVGQVFLEQAQLTLQQHRRAVESARNAATRGTTVLSVGFEPCAAFHGLEQVVQTFAQTYPDIVLVSHRLTAPEQEEALLGGRIDAGFLHPPIRDSRLVFEKVGDEAFVCALSTAYPLGRRRRVALADLAAEPFVPFPRDLAPACYDIIQGMCREAGFTPRVQHVTSDLDFCLRLVASGVGVTVAPASAREHYIRGVVYRELSHKTPRVETGFVRRPGELSPQLAKLLAVWRTYAGER